jgi:hypothetical protein
MTELDLLNLTRSATVNEVSWFSQMITINFAMVVAIYYFLNQANLTLRLFAFVAYTIGMLVFLGEMLIETNIKAGVSEALAALPAQSLSRPTLYYLAAAHSWLGMTTVVVFNASFWVLWLSVFYLLFFWKKSAHTP